MATADTKKLYIPLAPIVRVINPNGAYVLTSLDSRIDVRQYAEMFE